MLPTEVIVRYEQMLHTDNNLELREARCYYKTLDTKKKAELRKKRQAQKKKQAEKEKGDQKWLEKQADLTTKAIMDYIKDMPLFTLNYKQAMLSDEILVKLDQCMILKKPSRKTKNHYEKAIVESLDKIAVWMDTLTRFVDIQTIDSDEDVPSVTTSSEEEEELGEETEEEWEEETLTEETEEEASTEEMEEASADEIEEELAEDIEEEWEAELEEEEDAESEFEEKIFIEQLKELLLEEEEETFFDADLTLSDDETEEMISVPVKKRMDEKLDEVALAELIKLLENSPERDLVGFVHGGRDMPPVKYEEVLERLKALQAGEISWERKPKPLEGVIVEWLRLLNPEKIDNEMLNEIRTAVDLMGEWWEDDSEQRVFKMKNVITLMTAISEESPDAELLEEGMLRDFKEIKEGKGAGSALDGESEGEEAVEEEEVAEGIKEDEVMEEEVEEEEIFADEEVFAPQIIKEAPIVARPVIEEKEAEAQRLEVGVIIYEPVMEITAAEVGHVIKGHKPSSIFEHSPTMVCCLSLKTWAVWLLEITDNARNWTRWVQEVIQTIRGFVATIRGDVVGADGKTKVLYKQEWRDFADEVDEMIVGWRQYSAHVSELSTSIVENFHGKEVKCCPKCLQDHLIKNVVTAHETLQALTEAMSCAGYWQRCLDEIVEKTSVLAGKENFVGKELENDESSDDSGDAYLEDVSQDEDDDDGVYEIEQIAVFSPEEPAVDEPDDTKVVKSESKSTTKEKKGKGKDKKGKKK